MNAVTPLRPRKLVQTIDEHVVEIMSDSGEGAQKCGQSFGSIAARMGNGVWTVEIIPAEIQPPARSVAGASGNRIRIGSKRITNGGDEADLAQAVAVAAGDNPRFAEVVVVDANGRVSGVLHGRELKELRDLYYSRLTPANQTRADSGDYTFPH